MELLSLLPPDLADQPAVVKAAELLVEHGTLSRCQLIRELPVRHEAAYSAVKSLVDAGLIVLTRGPRNRADLTWGVDVDA